MAVLPGCIPLPESTSERKAALQKAQLRSARARVKLALSVGKKAADEQRKRAMTKIELTSDQLNSVTNIVEAHFATFPNRPEDEDMRRYWSEILETLKAAAPNED